MYASHRVACLLVVSVALLPAIFATSCASQTSEGFADRWDRFVILVWQFKTPPPGPVAKAAYESVKLGGVHLDNGFSDELLNFAKENDYPFYVDHAAGKGYLYLKKDVWAEFSAGYKADRDRPERPNCLRDPGVIQTMKDLITNNVTRAKTGPVVAYAFDDEISMTTFTSPADVCWSDACLAAFSEWLEEQYGTIEALNAEWETDYADFSEAEPLHVDDLRDVHDLPFDQWNLARWADHRSFTDTTFADVLADLVKHSNDLDPSVPAGFVGGQAPAAYGGYDYAKLTRAVQWMEAYDIGASNEILRSFFGQGQPHVQTYFSNYKPKSDTWWLWYYLVHGNRGVICWPDRNGTPWFEGETAQPAIQAMADTYEELQGPISEVFVNAKLVHDGIAVYYSQPSIQVSWFMDIKPHGSTWINRSSSLNSGNATDIMNRWAWLKLLEDCGYQYEFVSYLDVLDGRLESDEFDTLILPRTLALSDAEAAAITTFVEAGGTVIADYLPGVFDQHGKGREVGALDDLFGVARDASKGVLDGEHIAEVNAELYQSPLEERMNHAGAIHREGVVMYERGLDATTGEAAEIVEGTAIGVTNTRGEGRTMYLNVSPIPYLFCRYDEEGETYREGFGEIFRGAGREVRVRIFDGDEELAGVERLVWEKDGRYYLCIIWNALPKAKVDGVEIDASTIEGPERMITLKFRGEVTLTNVRTGEALGSGSEFDDAWLPCEANVYEVVVG